MSQNLKKNKKPSEKVDIKTIRLFCKIIKIVAPREIMKISEWAENYRYLSSGASAEPGKWNTDRATYQREMMDAVSDPNTEVIVFMTSAQIGKTEILLNILGYFIDYEPAPILYVLPTKELAEPFSKDRLAPMIRDTPVLKDKIGDVKSRLSDNTILHKKFPGGQISIVGANSPASLSSRPIRVVLCDEMDRFPFSAGTEGDPFELAKKRTTTFWNKKIIAVSTPTTKGISRIEKEYDNSTMDQWCVPCPNCGYYQPLEWPRIIFIDGEYKKPTMKCLGCDERFFEREWKDNFPIGKWVARQDSKIRGFHINELSSPWKTWDEVIHDFKQANKNGPEALKVWVNTALGESWVEKGDGADESTLKSRREVYGADIPNGVLLLTAGVDVQDDRFEVEVIGWGRDYESWGIRYTKIFGDLEKKEPWDKLEEFLDSEFYFTDGTGLNIAATCIDSGGHFTTEVYRFCKKLRHKKVFPIKGMGGEGVPFIHRITKIEKENVQLFVLGVNAGKESLLHRIKTENTEKSGPGYCHFPVEKVGYDSTYFAGLTSEYRVVKTDKKGKTSLVWEVKTGIRNEPFDIRNYGTAALEIISPINWSALESKLAKGINYIKKPKRTVNRQRRSGVVSRGIEV